jgi:predicted CxxxxCH...CXXCH cytochrome family protein
VQKLNNSCLTCHTKQSGPEACNTCHGDFAGDAADLKKSAPPKGLDDETDPTTPAVGAHEAHFVYFDKLTTAAVCQECHALPQSFAAPGHVDPDGHAELLFEGALTTIKTEGGARVPNASYNAANNTCAGTYCHGNWGLLKSQSSNSFIFTADKMEGLNASPRWTDTSSPACGSCHALPPTGHRFHDVTVCSICHFNVMDENGNIIDKTMHINGKVNVFGQEYPMY